MRIAFAHYSSVDDISGVTSWLIQLALHLKAEGCSVAVALMDLCGHGDTSPIEVALRNGGIEIFKAPPTGSLRQDVNATLAFLNGWRPDVFLPQCKPHHYIAAAIAGRAASLGDSPCTATTLIIGPRLQVFHPCAMVEKQFVSPSIFRFNLRNGAVNLKPW
jgi:hypothetical protein